MFACKLALVASLRSLKNVLLNFKVKDEATRGIKSEGKRNNTTIARSFGIRYMWSSLIISETKFENFFAFQSYCEFLTPVLHDSLNQSLKGIRLSTESWEGSALERALMFRFALVLSWRPDFSRFYSRVQRSNKNKRK